MNDRPTPETDAAIKETWAKSGVFPALVPAMFSRRLERERDEARRLAEEGRLGHIPSNAIFPWESKDSPTN